MRTRTAAVVALAVLLAAAPAASAHQGDPHFLSQVDRITPPVAGVTVDVLNRDDRLLLHNTSGRDVVVLGYQREPYARVLADGSVQVNTRSPAYYLNDERYANVTVPPGIDARDPPRWRELDRTGRFEWHDHRMHWMARGHPPQLADPGVRQKIFDWRIPVRIAGVRGAIAGRLLWTPLPGGGPPLAAIAGLAAFAIACCLAVFAVRHRRRGGTARADREPVEAW